MGHFTCIEEIRNAYVVCFVSVVVTELCIVPVFILMSSMRPNIKMIGLCYCVCYT
jgi:hypothetical protein